MIWCLEILAFSLLANLIKSDISEDIHLLIVIVCLICYILVFRKQNKQ